MTERADEIWGSLWMGIYLNDGTMYHPNIHGDNLGVSLSGETS